MAEGARAHSGDDISKYAERQSSLASGVVCICCRRREVRGHGVVEMSEGRRANEGVGLHPVSDERVISDPWTLHWMR